MKLVVRVQAELAEKAALVVAEQELQAAPAEAQAAQELAEQELQAEPVEPVGEQALQAELAEQVEVLVGQVLVRQRAQAERVSALAGRG
ncbi:hypothetical protein CMO91_01000 [Candidatus Woesearchaeota archaeon]|nr:hypothetical protein [Candidatus Woesearchaeota archaeon]|tara:strand:+ start:1326 stop:1592 length:267 start_codon:yes stop_codon:yes gene_type:complete